MFLEERIKMFIKGWCMHTFMARILELKNTNDKKVLANVELSQDEYNFLKGNIENIHVFSENNLIKLSRLVQRGKKESTKYFLLPKILREDIIPTNNVKCNKIETSKKKLFIFEIEK